jgi:hypothetical protein
LFGQKLKLKHFHHQGGEMKIKFCSIPFSGSKSREEMNEIASSAAKKSFDLLKPVEIQIGSEAKVDDKLILEVDDLPEVPMTWSKGKEVTLKMQIDYINSIFAVFMGELFSAMNKKWFGRLKIVNVQVILRGDGEGRIRLLFGKTKDNET